MAGPRTRRYRKDATLEIERRRLPLADQGGKVLGEGAAHQPCMPLSHRRDVLIEPEEIHGIIRGLHGHQPHRFCRAVGCLDSAHIVLRLVIDIQATGRERLGSVSKVEIATPMDLIYKVLFPSISTFETPPPLSLQRHLYAHVFKHKELGASKKPLTLVTDDRKSAILHRQILATHPSDVVGL